MIELIHGDCLDVLPALGKKVDLVLTDPPYGTTKCKWDSIVPLESMWSALGNVTGDTTPIVLFGTQPFTSNVIGSNFKDFKYCWYWDKVIPRGHLVAKKRPMAQVEDICVFYKMGVPYKPIMEKREKPQRGKEGKRTEIMGGESSGYEKVYTEKYPTTLLRFKPVSAKERIHPTQKPLDLLEYLIKTYTNEGDTVLDFTVGSGSTCIAAESLGRNSIGIEKDEQIFEQARLRINKYLVSTGKSMI